MPHQGRPPGAMALASSLSIWVTIIGSQVQPGGFPTLTLHPSHAQQTFPVNVAPSLRSTWSHSQLRWCFSVMLEPSQAGGVECRGRGKKSSPFPAVGDIWTLMIRSNVSRELSTARCPPAPRAGRVRAERFAHASAATGIPSCLLCCSWEAAQPGKKPVMWVEDQDLSPAPVPARSITVGERCQPSRPQLSCLPSEK